MTEAKPKRRRFRFGLRMLFALVTIIGVLSGWVVYQLNWIRERHKVITFSETTPGTKIGYYSSDLVVYAVSEDIRPHQVAPIQLRLFGERGYSEIGLRHASDNDAERFERMFPEATIIRLDK
jgi:hypothetical protein